MNNLNLNTIFNRNELAIKIKDILLSFDEKCKELDFKKGIYIYGAPGTGKTRFILDILKELNYDVIKYDAGDVRNKSLIDTITRDNVSRYNVLDMMCGRMRKISILMDEIDGMHKGDKGGISALVKLIRQKKTKKQKTENVTLNPVICIGNYYMDKKIKELMNVCNVFELTTPTNEQIGIIYKNLIPKFIQDNDDCVGNCLNQMIHYAQGDLRKVEFILKLNETNPEMLASDNMQNIFRVKFYNEDYNKIVKHLFDHKLTVGQHSEFMSDNDRTTVALLWHENVADRISHLPKSLAYPFYLKLIDNICFADYIDRITFQNQIWIFNEMSTFIKTFYNNFIFHGFFETRPAQELEKIRRMMDIRFTKVLTKYSTEYSNQLFLYMMCQTLDMDKKDLVAFFQEMRIYYGGNEQLNKIEIINDVEKMFDDTKICKLDIKRIYRYLDKNVKKEISVKSHSGEDDCCDFDGDDDDEDDGYD